MSKVNLKMFVTVCALIMALSGPAGAVTHYVNPGHSIQAAIDDPSTLDGDEIEVAPGTYNEAIDLKGKAVRLYSRGGPEVTIIDANGIAGAYHVVQCTRGELRNTVLEGFTITGGNANGSYPNDRGGGIYCSGSSPTIAGCIVTGNAADYGGGIYTEISYLAIIGCKICNNEAYGDGGGLFFWSSYPELNYSVMINCEIYNNLADNGGGILSDHSKPTITNCTFSANEANLGPGGALASWAGGVDDTPLITNCIFWEDTPAEIACSPFSPFVLYCDVQGGYTGPGNINADPCFVNAAGGNLQLSPASPCINVGLRDLDTDFFTPGVQPLPEDDLNGSPRIYPIYVDMGAYEHRDSDGDGITDGFDTPSVHNLTRGTDHFTIQAAINGALLGDEIEVLPGTYNESINFKGKAVRVYSSAGPEVTIIDANGIADAYHVVQCVSGENANTVLEGFKITGGIANGAGTYESCGGGILCVLSSPTIAGCIVTGNAAVRGGGIYTAFSSPAVIGCKIYYNVAINEGGGLYFWLLNPVMINCEIYNNWANEGGGMVSFHSHATITNCTFSANEANPGLGGALASVADANVNRPLITNCIFWGDTPYEISFSSVVFFPLVQYCDVQGGYIGAGNINADPCFVDADANDFRLLHDSPCIDAGDNDSVPEEIETDLDGRARFVDGDCNTTIIVDMGAFEFTSAYFGDFDSDCDVDFFDYAIQADFWMTDELLVDIAPTPAGDGIVDTYDLAILCDNWLAEL